jgi:hypothetical protein
MVFAGTPNVIRLKSEGGGHLIVVPEDQDRFVLTIEEAVKACRAYERTRSFENQFNILLRRLAHWIDEHRDLVRIGYLTVRDAGLLFLVVTKAAEYDRKLEDDLTDLDLEVANDPNLDLIRLSVLAIPPTGPEAIRSYLSPGFTLQYADA